MPDFVSKKRLKKKGIDGWKSQDRMTPTDLTKAVAAHPPPKRKRKKLRQASQDGASDRAQLSVR